MTTQFDRRRLIKGVAGLALAPLAVSVIAPALTRSTFAAAAGPQSLGNAVSVISDVGANAVVFAGREGNVLIDSGAASATRTLLEHLKSLTGSDRANTVFNTHYHADQTGGNATLAKGGAKIIAHERTRQWLGTPYWMPAELRYSTPAPQDALPTETFYGNGSLDLGDEQLEFGYLVEAHTSSDIYVKFTQANVLAVGDVVSPERDPSFDWYTGAWVGGRRDALDTLLALSDENTAIVPAYGPVLTRAHVEAERDLIAFIYDKTVDLVRMGFGPEDMLADGFMGTLPRQFDEPDAFLYDLCKGLWAHHNKLNHNIV